MSAASDRRAIGLYAVLARDWCDFLDMVIEEEDVEALKTLYLMLATPMEGQNEQDKRLNELGAPLVKGNLEKRGVPIPSIEEPARLRQVKDSQEQLKL